MFVILALTSVFGPELDGGVGPDPLQVLGRQLDDVVGVLLQAPDGVVLHEESKKRMNFLFYEIFSSLQIFPAEEE